MVLFSVLKAFPEVGGDTIE